MNAKMQILLLDMTNHGVMSGVDRYMEMLIEALSSLDRQHYKVIRTSLIKEGDFLGCRSDVINGVQSLRILLPQMSEEIIRERYWLHHYNEHVVQLLAPYLDPALPLVIHTHTLNLIDLALLLKQQLPLAKVITHLHCIPWKGFVNHNRVIFNKLYRIYHTNQAPINREIFLTNNCEEQAYLESDHIVCLTKCAEEFLHRMFSKGLPRISLIPNGIEDWAIDYKRNYDCSNVLKIIYVGSIAIGKGLEYILCGIRCAQEKGYVFKISVAGFAPIEIRVHLANKYPDIDLEFKGTLETNSLIELYQWADIGIIASLQEQCSYVALEMAMMGLPIITTAVDGLDEIFTHNVNALKVELPFSRVRGLTVNFEQMAQYLIELSESMELRLSLGTAARKLYLEKYQLDTMRNKTIDLYNSVIGLNTYGEN